MSPLFTVRTDNGMYWSDQRTSGWPSIPTMNLSENGTTFFYFLTGDGGAESKYIAMYSNGVKSGYYLRWDQFSDGKDLFVAIAASSYSTDYDLSGISKDDMKHLTFYYATVDNDNKFRMLAQPPDAAPLYLKRVHIFGDYIDGQAQFDEFGIFEKVY